MKYETLEGGVIASFNRLITSISKRGDKVLIKQMSDHTDKLELLLDYSKKRESDTDELILESSLAKERVSKSASIFKMLISNVDLDDLSNQDIMDFDVMRKGGFYTAKSFLDASNALDDKKWLKRMGFKFKNDLSLEELKAKINQSQQKLISKYETIEKR